MFRVGDAGRVAADLVEVGAWTGKSREVAADASATMPPPPNSRNNGSNADIVAIVLVSGQWHRINVGVGAIVRRWSH